MTRSELALDESEHSPKNDRRLPKWLGEQRVQPWGELDRFDRASVAVDGLVLTMRDRRLHVLLHRREVEPEVGRWGLPGGMVHWGEQPEDALRRVLRSKVGLDVDIDPLLVIPVNDFGRDPRGWIVTHGYLLPMAEPRPLPSTAVAFMPVDSTAPDDQVVELPDAWIDVPGEGAAPYPGVLAFQHQRIIRAALDYLRAVIAFTDIGLRFMPERFTVRQLQDLHEAVLGEEVNRANFRRMAVDTRGWIRPTGDFLERHGYRRTELFERAV